MQLLQVIPITKSVSAEVLTYFSAKPVELGTLVTVPLRKKNTQAIVVHVESAMSMKSILRSATYQVRNIREIHTIQVFSPAFLKTCHTLKNFYATTTGAIMSQTSPSFILDHLSDETYHRPHTRLENTSRELLLQQPYTDRITHYKTMIREHQARHASVHVICATTEEVMHCYEHLQKNNDHVYQLHSGITKARARKLFKEIIHLEESSVLISTPLFIDTYQHNKETLVIEHESSAHYYTPSQPYIDMRIMIYEYAKQMKLNIIWADTALRPETYTRQENFAECIEPFNKRIFREQDIHIVRQHITKELQTDEERIRELQSSNREFTTLANETRALLTESIKRKEKIFIYAHRKGLAPNIVCNDCGNIARSHTSGLPYSLYITHNHKTKKSERKFICNLTGESILAFDTCQFCRGHNLVQLGIGTERVYEELKKLFPKVPTYIIDSTHTPTKKVLQEIIETYQKTTASVIIVGTQKALPHLDHIDRVIIASLDSVFSRMSYNVHVDVLNLLTRLHERSIHPLVLQSRNITEFSLPIVRDGLYAPYIKRELDERKRFSYPPYGHVCVIQKDVTKQRVQQHYRIFEEALKPHEPYLMIQPGRTRTRSRIVIILQLDTNTWSMKQQDAKLAIFLGSLDRDCTVQFDPYHLF